MGRDMTAATKLSLLFASAPLRAPRPSQSRSGHFRVEQFMDGDSVGLSESLDGRESQIDSPTLFDQLIVLVADSRSLGELLLGNAMKLAQLPESDDEAFTDGVCHCRPLWRPGRMQNT
jgi:hypothetical protein